MKTTDVLAVLGAISPVLLLLLGAWLKKRADNAIAQKNEADARVSEATAQKVKAETDSFVLANAIRIVDEFKKQQGEKDEMTAEKLATGKEKVSNLEGRINRMEEGFARLRAALATHGVWDAAALVDLRTIKPDYPEPPRIPDRLE